MIWKNSHKKIVCDNLDKSDAEIGKLIGASANNVKNFRRRNGILKHASGFRSGHSPWTKGKKTGIRNNGQFKRGHNLGGGRAIGTVFQQDDHGKITLLIKLADNRRYGYARYVYEQANGVKLPSDVIVAFKDRNPMNCELSNLKLMSRRDNLKRNRNPKKGGKSMKLAWGVHRTLTEYGVRSPYKLRLKKVA